jgi:hypothetical protein
MCRPGRRDEDRVLNYQPSPMNNTFASGSDPSLGHPADASEPSLDTHGESDIEATGPDVTATLAELEHKLLELERELSAIDTVDIPTPTEQISESEAVPSDTGTDDKVEVAAELEQEPVIEQPAQPAAKLIDESLLQDSPELEPSDATTAEEPQWEIIAESARVIDETAEPDTPAEEASVAPAAPIPASVIAELEGFRDRLELLTQELRQDYSELVSSLTAQASQTVPDSIADAEPVASADALPFDDDFEDPSPASFSRPNYFEGPPATDIPDVSFQSPLGRQAAPIEPDITATPTQASSAEPDAATEPSPEDEAVFFEHVEIGVGPFYDISSLSAFEREIARAPNVTETAVRRFEASHAVIDLHLTAPTALVSELRTVVSTPFHVRQLADSRLSLTFDES